MQQMGPGAKRERVENKSSKSNLRERVWIWRAGERSVCHHRKSIQTTMPIYTPVVYKKIKSRAISPGLRRVEGGRMESEWLRWGQKSSPESSIGAFYCGSMPEEHPQHFCSLDISNSNLCSLMCRGTKTAMCYVRINKLTFFQYMWVSSTTHLLQHSKSYLKKNKTTIWKDYLKQDKPGCSLVYLEEI